MTFSGDSRAAALLEKGGVGNYESRKSLELDNSNDEMITAEIAIPFWQRFLPAIIVYPIWIYIMAETGSFKTAFEEYYVMALAMTIGSFIAGSTPLGGGIVGFPVSVLVLGFNPDQGRDFSSLIQSVGMSAAAFLLLTTKKEFVSLDIVVWSIISGTIGILIGSSIQFDGYYVNIVFATYILSFAIIYFYKNEILDKANGIKGENLVQTRPGEFYKGALGDSPSVGSISILCAVSIIGGMFTSELGSGSDTVAYIFCAFYLNMYLKRGIPDTTMTATSVVVMACLTIVQSLVAGFTGNLDEEALLAWGASLWVVALGAPIGSLVLTPERIQLLRWLFYTLAVVQFISFGAIKIKDDVFSWLGIAIVLLVVVAVVLCDHFFYSAQRHQ